MSREQNQTPDPLAETIPARSVIPGQILPGRRERLKRWAKQYPTRAAGAVLLAGAVLFVILDFVPGKLFEDFSANIATELASIAVTVLFIDYLNERRQNEQLKAQLIREMGASDNGIALRAVRELHAYGWLADGSLRGADLTQANLQGASLWGADLQEATLLGAILEEADLSRVNLRGASLAKANLMGADLSETQMQGALLWWANLTNADLTQADLQGTVFEQADLRGTRLYGVKHFSDRQLAQAAFLEGATMPDGTIYEGNE